MMRMGLGTRVVSSLQLENQEFKLRNIPLLTRLSYAHLTLPKPYSDGSLMNWVAIFFTIDNNIKCGILMKSWAFSRF